MKNKPNLPHHLEAYIEAFWMLCADRANGMDTPIRFTAISEFATRFGIGDEDRQEFRRFCEIMSSLDNAWIKHQNQRARDRQYEREARQAAWGAVKEV